MKLNKLIKTFSILINKFIVLFEVSEKYRKQKYKRIMLLSKCAVCDSKKSKFIKEREASRLLNSLEIKTSLSKIPLVVPLLF